MPTPQTAAPAAAPAAAATSSAGEAQPMAVSPAPEAQGASAEAAAAADQQLGAQQAGSQQQLQAQQAQQAAALPYGMPAMLFEAVLQSNLRHLSTIQLFSVRASAQAHAWRPCLPCLRVLAGNHALIAPRLPPPTPPQLQPEYSRFMWRLTEHLQDGVKAGNARKSAKREPTSSPGMDAAGGGSGSGLSGMAGGDCQLAALTSRRGCVRAGPGWASGACGRARPPLRLQGGPCAGPCRPAFPLPRVVGPRPNRQPPTFPLSVQRRPAGRDC